MEFKNNVTRFLDAKKVKYTLLLYDYEAGVRSAMQVADEVSMPQKQVFKTLVVLPGEPSRKPMLVLIPAPDTLDLKSLAQAVGVKKVKMATHAEAEALTGLLAGGISPLALINRGFDVYISDHAQQFTSIAISAGKRGANVVLAVKDIVRLTRARMVTLDG